MNAKTQSILSYLGILWLVAYFGGKDHRDANSIYHLKQGLGLLVVAVLYNLVVTIVISIAPGIGQIIGYVGVVFLILMILGIIHVVNEIKKPLPLIGGFFEDKFSFIQ